MIDRMNEILCENKRQGSRQFYFRLRRQKYGFPDMCSQNMSNFAGIKSNDLMYKTIFLRYLTSFLLFILTLIHFTAYSDTFFSPSPDSLWVDSVYRSMSPDERIGQLFMIRAFSGRDKIYNDELTEIIKSNHVGGVCFFKGSPVNQANLTNYWQSISKVPLLIAIDGEWGLGMRLDSTISFPRQMTLGAIADDSLIYKMGTEIARECHLMNINMNFAPVVDINSNPANPVINIRSFGENKFNVTQKSLMYMNGLQDHGLLATAKHFPGHGDTDADSHLTLPLISHSAKEIDTLDLYPFKQLINNGLSSIMVAHLFVPSLDSAKNAASSLSYPVITGLLRNKLGFNGLVFTDALDMNGVTKYSEPGKIELKALEAGNDILLLPQDVQTAICEIEQAIDSGKLSRKLIEDKCKKILHYKYIAGLANNKRIDTQSLFKELNLPESQLLCQHLYEPAITLVKNQNGFLPIQRPDTLKIATVIIGDTLSTVFQQMLENYSPLTHFNLPENPSREKTDNLLAKLSDFNLVIAGIVDTHPSPVKNFGISRQTIALIDTLQKHKKIILDIFAIPYALNSFKGLSNIEAIAVSYQDNPVTQNLSAQAIFGGIPFLGKLPVTGSSEFPIGTGFVTTGIQRFKYTFPEDAGISSRDLDAIDSIALKGIAAKAYPGCRVLVAKDGKVIYDKSFGYHTYDNKTPVRNTDIYDLASVTKIAATTLAVMKLYEEGKIDLDKKLSKYLLYLKKTNKRSLVLRDIMTHQAGLQSFIPGYPATLRNGQPDPEIYHKTFSEAYPYRVAEGMFMRKDYAKVMFDSIAKSPVSKKKEYKYSDLGFMLLCQVVESVTGESLDKYVDSVYYKPLGLSTMGFNPRHRFDLTRIPPTENDTIFRHQLVHGDVHDPRAAMLGGVSGHAGLFSDAGDLAVLMQMLLNKGNYAGVRYLDTATVDLFTSTQFLLTGNRRALGFDKPMLDISQPGPTCRDASYESFGHTGFTGTYAWADPEYGIVYVFLSNRIYPDAENKKLSEMNIRTDIQQVIYDAIKKQRGQ